MTASAEPATSPGASGKRVLVVDDHADFRRLAGALLRSAGYVVVGEASGGVEALARTRELAPDVILLDVQMPGTDGIAVAEQLQREPAPPAVVLVSARPAEEYGERLRGCEVAGFLPKQDLTVAAFAALVP